MGAIIIEITKLVKHFAANVTDVEIHTLVKMYIIKDYKNSILQHMDSR